MLVSRSLRFWFCCLVLIQLVACKGGNDSTQSTLPIVSITVAANVPATAVVTLDGGGSTARNGGTLAYKWALTSKPVGSTASISDTTVVAPLLTTDVAGTYVVTLTITDGTTTSSLASAILASAYTPPTIISDIVEPVSGAVQLALSSDPGATTITWSADGTVLGTGTPLSWDTTTVANGSHVVVALLQFSGYTISLNRTFLVGQTTVSFNNATVSQTGGVFTALLGAQSTNGIVRVDATLDGVAVGSLTATNACLDSTGVACATSGPNGYQFTGSAASGAHIVIVTATDGAGNHLSTQLRFTV